jgi:hypothetical protein
VFPPARIGLARDPRRAVYLLVHTDARFTLRVYQQVLDAAPGSLDVLEQVMGCTREEAREIFESGAVARARSSRVLRTNSEQRRSMPSRIAQAPSAEG